MRLGIVTCSTPNRQWLYSITNQTKVKYCSIHNIDYIFSDQFYPDKQRHPYWNKIAFIRTYLPKYDWVLWMDDDAGFISSESIFSIFDTNAQLLYANDLNGFNAGVMAFNNTDRVQKCLDCVWNTMYYLYKDHSCPEQDALYKLFVQDLHIGGCIDGSIYNAYNRQLTISDVNQATENTIILHIAGGTEFKQNHITDISQLYQPYISDI